MKKNIFIFGLVLLLSFGIVLGINETGKEKPFDTINKTKENPINFSEKYKNSDHLMKENNKIKSGKAEIHFNNGLSDTKGIYVKGHSVYIDSKKYPNKNKTAEIIFKDVEYIEPIILKNGKQIDIPFKYDKKKKTVTFEVNGFSEYELTDSVVSYYKFDGDATDAHSTNDGTVNGATQTSSGKINQAYSFDGSNDYITISVPYNTYNSNYTISGWYYNEATTGVQAVYSFSEGDYKILIFFNNNGNEVGFVHRTTSDDYQVAVLPITLNDNEWYHFTAIKTSTGLKIIVNGDEASLSTSNFWETSSGISYIGVRRFDGFNSYADGIIDEVAIWSRALTSSDVSELYNSDSGLQYPFITDTYLNLNINSSRNETTNINGTVEIENEGNYTIIDGTVETNVTLNATKANYNFTFYNLTENNRPYFNRTLTNVFFNSTQNNETYSVDPYSKVEIQNNVTNENFNNFSFIYDSVNYSTTNGYKYIPSFNESITLDFLELEYFYRFNHSYISINDTTAEYPAKEFIISAYDSETNEQIQSITAEVDTIEYSTNNSKIILDDYLFENVTYSLIIVSADGYEEKQRVEYNTLLGSLNLSLTPTSTGTGTGDVTVNIYDNETYNETLEMGNCPQTKQGQSNLRYLIIILLGVGILGFAIKIPALALGSGAFLLFLTLITGFCGNIMGIFTFIFGGVYIMMGLSIKM